MLCFCFRKRKYRDIGFVSEFLLEGYNTIDQSEKSMVFAHSDIFTWIVHCSSLADEDVASFGNLTTEQLDAEAFAL